MELTKLQTALQKSREQTLSPPPNLNLVQWADTYRYLSPEASSIAGKWRTSVVEAARGPMLEVNNPKVKTITVVSSTQLMKTEFINNIVGYHIHQDPCPMIVMQPTIKMAETWAKDRLDKMLRDSPELGKLVPHKRSRGDGDNTILHRSFPGGHVTCVGANSPSDLAMRPVRLVLCDEIDKYPASAGKEGDPIKLIEERTDAFWNALHVRVCSPTIEGMSRIQEEYELGDQRTYHGKCPKCNQYEELLWENVVYDESDVDNTTFYKCSKCEHLWNEVDRIKAVNNGTYIAKKPFNGHASFKVNKLASPWSPLSSIVHKYLLSKDDSEKLKTFYNTQLAETFKIKADSPDHMRLYERREDYLINTVCSDAYVLTCGVDVQASRLELEIVAWGKDKQSWSVDYRTIPGQTGTSEPWDELEKVLNESWKTEDGRILNIRMLTVDSGYNTQHVYNWVRNQDPNRVRAIKGQDHLQMVFGKPSDVELNYNGQRIKNATRVWPVGVSLLKSELYGWLKMEGAKDDKEYKPGFCHFPQYDENYFQGLCSEQLVQVNVRGRPALQWQKKFERNEPLDCRNYARAAASMFGIDRFTEEEWEILKGQSYEEIRTKTSMVGEGVDLDEDDSSDSFWDDRKGRLF